MNNWEIKRRIDNLADKLKDDMPHDIIRLDFDSFSEKEKLVFQRANQVAEEFQRTGSAEGIPEKMSILQKEREILYDRIRELYCFAMPALISYGENNELIEYFFKWHFYNFEQDLFECLSHIRETWSEKNVEEFISDLRKNGSYFFRIPRGFNESNRNQRKGRNK